MPEIGWWVDPATIPLPIDFDFMRRAGLAGKKFACDPRPTALKFPSNVFSGAYRTGEPAPIQHEYFRRLREDPVALKQELLRELARRFAQFDRGGGATIFAREQRGLVSMPPLCGRYAGG